MMHPGFSGLSVQAVHVWSCRVVKSNECFSNYTTEK